MNKKLTVLLIAVGIIFTGSLVWLLLGMRTPEQMRCEVIQGGQVLYTFDLHTAEDQDIRIDAPDGTYNIVTIRNGDIYISEAGCPDHTCMKTGVLRSENLPIVCLPNQLVIRFAE